MLAHFSPRASSRSELQHTPRPSLTQQVILLSSMLVDNPRARSAAAREVISCLSTFATLVAMNQNFTRRLKREVDERTKQLRDALAAKTQFLSQCSHELRSPLSAVLVSQEDMVLYNKLIRRVWQRFSESRRAYPRYNGNICRRSNRVARIFSV